MGCSDVIVSTFNVQEGGGAEELVSERSVDQLASQDIVADVETSGLPGDNLVPDVESGSEAERTEAEP